MALESLAYPWQAKEDNSLFLRSTMWVVARFRRLLPMFGVDEPVFRETAETAAVLT